MKARGKAIVRDAATALENALQSIGCYTPIRMIDHGTAIQVGSFADTLTVRYTDYHWQVSEHAPYMERTRLYDSMEDCVHDIAMCDETAVVLDQIDRTEQRIDDAIGRAFWL